MGTGPKVLWLSKYSSSPGVPKAIQHQLRNWPPSLPKYQVLRYPWLNMAWELQVWRVTHD